MKTRDSLLVVAVSVLLNLGTVPAQERRSPSTAPPERGDAERLSARLDSLLNERNLDSVQAIVARGLPDAVARGDTAAVCVLLLARAQSEQLSGRLREARDAFALAREWTEAAGDSARWMSALRAGAYTAGILGMREESVALNLRLLEVAQAAGDPTYEAWARTGFAYRAMIEGDMAAARAGYERAIRLFRTARDLRSELVPLVGLGRVYTSIGEIDSARACFQRVWIKATEVGQHIEAAHALNNLGTLEHRFGDLALAMEYYRGAFETHRAQGEVNNAITAASNLALAYQAGGRFDQAVDILEQQLGICEAAGLRPQVGLVRKNLGFAHSSASQHQAAIKAFRGALALGDTIDSRVRLDATWGLADALAVDSLEAGIQVLRRSIQRGSSGDVTDDVSVRIALARLLSDGADPAEALSEARSALAAITPAAPERVRARLHLVASRCYRRAGLPDSALTMLEAGVSAMRATTFAAARLTGGNYMSDLICAAEILLEHPAGRPPADRHAAFFDLMEEFRAAHQRESISDPRRVSEAISRPVTLRDVQRDLLAPGDLLLDFFVAVHKVFLFAVSRDTTVCVPLPGTHAPLARKIEDFCNAAAERPDAHGLPASDLAQLQAVLGEDILGSVAGLVVRSQRLLIVPDQHLHALPFGMLALPAAAGEPVPLVERADILILPSASALANLRAHDNESARDFLVVAADDGAAETLRGARAEAKLLDRRYAGVVESRGSTTRELCDRMERSRLIHIAAHIDVNAQEPWYSGIQVGTVPEKEPQAPVRSASEPAAEPVGILSSDDSLFVARTFAPDRYLRAHQVAELSLSARLAVLSGCESALGRLTMGEGVIGLGSAFLQAGVPTVIGSLWKIDDRTTVDLMKFFYDGLADGLTVTHALRRAQLEIRSQERTAHPFYWAGFVVVGDGRQMVPLARKPAAVFTPTVAATLVLLTAAGWALTRTRKKRESQRPL